MGGDPLTCERGSKDRSLPLPGPKQHRKSPSPAVRDDTEDVTHASCQTKAVIPSAARDLSSVLRDHLLGKIAEVAPRLRHGRQQGDLAEAHRLPLSQHGDDLVWCA